jgi:hypothetical protein
MSEDRESSQPSRERRLTEIDIDFLKSAHFRVIHVDGAWGGVSPHLNIHMTVYNERPAIPQKMVHAVTPDGELGPELSKRSRAALVREVEADLIMNLSTAKALHEWLGKQIAMLGEAVQKLKSEGKDVDGTA